MWPVTLLFTISLTRWVSNLIFGWLDRREVTFWMECLFLHFHFEVFTMFIFLSQVLAQMRSTGDVNPGHYSKTIAQVVTQIFLSRSKKSVFQLIENPPFWRRMAWLSPAPSSTWVSTIPLQLPYRFNWQNWWTWWSLWRTWKSNCLILISTKNVHCKVAILMITFLPLRIFSQTVLLQGGIQGELAGMSTTSSCN